MGVARIFDWVGGVLGTMLWRMEIVKFYQPNAQCMLSACTFYPS